RRHTRSKRDWSSDVCSSDLNPLIELDLDLSGARKPAYSRGGRALTAEQYRAAVEYLLAAAPGDVEVPKRGRWTHEQRVAERAACRDVGLAQAASRMRACELCRRPAPGGHVDDAATFIVELSPEATKTRTGRPVPVLAPAVSQRLAARLESGSPWLFPSPTDPAKPWDPRNRDRKLAAMYKELAEKLNIEMLDR